MAPPPPRIEKILGSVFSTTVVKRKDATDQDDTSKKESQEQKKDNPQGNSQPQPQLQDEQRKADRPSVEKAITDLQGASQFVQTGMRVEMVETKEGLIVKMLHPNGTVIKSMSAEDFLKLRDSSLGDRLLRGNILDQKF